MVDNSDTTSSIQVPDPAAAGAAMINGPDTTSPTEAANSVPAGAADIPNTAWPKQVRSPVSGSLVAGSVQTATAYEEKLIADLERMVRFASTAKAVEVAAAILGQATDALQKAKSAISENQALTAGQELNLLIAIDAMVPRIFPATPASLEIADLMDAGRINLSDREKKIKARIDRLIGVWTGITVLALVSVIALSFFSATVFRDLATFKLFIPYVNGPIIGILGACAYILRNILNNVAAKTFVIREQASYILRTILGGVLGYIMPLIYAGQDLTGTAPTVVFTISFLAGYAVEPMFAALDNIVTTLRDAVSKTQTVAGSK